MSRNQPSRFVGFVNHLFSGHAKTRRRQRANRKIEAGDIQSLEQRQLLSADNAGVLRNDQSIYLDLNGDPAHEIDGKITANGGDVVTGKWNGVFETFAVVTNVNGLLYWDVDMNGDNIPDRSFQFGARNALYTDTPVTGDWDGDGDDEAGVFRNYGAQVLTVAGNRRQPDWIRDMGEWGYQDSDGVDANIIQWGLIGDLPLVGNFDGDRADDFAVYRDGRFVLDIGTPGWQGEDFDAFSAVGTPVAGDFDGDGHDEFGAVRPVSVGGNQLLEWRLNDGRTFHYGLPGDRPVTGTWGAPEIHLMVEDGRVLYDDNPSFGRIDFETVEAGMYGTPIRIQISNHGTIPLDLSDLYVPDGFVVSELPQARILPGQSEWLGLTLHSDSQGIKAGEVSFRTNDSNETPFNFQIRGEVTPAVIPLPEVTVFINGQAIPDDNAVLDFGTYTVGDARPVIVVEVQNTGDAVLQLSNLTVPSGFVVVDGLTTEIQPGGADAVIIALDTTISGSSRGDVSFNSNDADENPFNFVVVGNVVQPKAEITVSVNGGREIRDGDSGAQTIDFGTVVAGDAGPQFTIRVENVGDVPLQLSNLRLPAGYEIVDNLETEIAPGESDLLTIRLSTATVGTWAGDVVFDTNDADESPFNFRITGTVQPRVVTAPEIAVRLPDGTELQVGDDIDFGAYFQHARGPEFTLTVVNTGNASLELGVLSLPAGYVTAEGLDSVLAPGDSDDFTIVLLTEQLGTKQGNVVIANNDADESPFTFAVTAEVVETQFVTFVADYGTVDTNTGFFDPQLGPARRQAFEYALGIWSQQLIASYDGETIVVQADMVSLGGGPTGYPIAGAAPTGWGGDAVLAPVALLNHILDQDLNGDAPEIAISFNADLDSVDGDFLGNFYYGLDGNSPATHSDFVTTTLHEIAHGLGFYSAIIADGTFEVFGQAAPPTIYDVFLTTGNGVEVIPMSAANRLAAVTGNDLRWNGHQGILNNGGTQPYLYAPAIFDDGSSVSHLDEGRHGDELLSPNYSGPDHIVSALELGILADMGWSTLVTPNTGGPENRPENRVPIPAPSHWMARSPGANDVVVSGSDDHPTVSWTSTESRGHFQVLVRDAVTGSIVEHLSTFESTDYQPNLAPGTYEVLIRNITDDMAGAWSEPVVFTVSGHPTVDEPVTDEPVTDEP
ncbi:MAG: choice-of-anchor D domain-containing protein, partial [Planctomycetaceae bacterium]|nr:choice-of-anchor D domain-containing protein [Planctomycetaceae bacterium]